MIPLLVFGKRFAAKSAARLTPSRVAQALAGHGADWTRGEIHFAGAIVYANAVKSLRTIARDHPALRPYFRMAPADGLAAAGRDDPAALDYEAATHTRDRELLVVMSIRLALDPEAADLASTLSLPGAILDASAPKAFKYTLQVTFAGIDFGPGTLRQLPAHDLEARERAAARLPLVSRMALDLQTRSAVVIRYGAANVELAGRCLLQEVADAKDLASAAVPPRFADVMTPLADFKARNVKRGSVVAVPDLERQTKTGGFTTPGPGSDGQRFAQRLKDLAREAEDRMRELAETGALPHRLETSNDLASAAEKFDRRRILDSLLQPLGYERVPQPVGSVGFYQYTKTAEDGEAIELMFDFGTWRRSVLGTFIFVAGSIPGLAGSRLNVRYRCWPRNGDVPITTEALFRQTFENIGALTTVLEREYVPRFRALLAEARG